MKEKIIVKSYEETLQLAKRIAMDRDGYNLLLLYGELGAGKTTFTKGFCSYFGFNDVSSPTFVIINRYPTSPIIHHIDLYRIDKLCDITHSEILDIIQDDESIGIVEWPEKLGGIDIGKHIAVDFKIIGENEREKEIAYN